MKTLIIKTGLACLSISIAAVFVQPVNADNLVASSTFPTIFFDETDVSPGVQEWEITAYSAGFGIWNSVLSDYLFSISADSTTKIINNTNGFFIADESLNPIVTIDEDAPQSFDIFSDGDIAMAEGALYFDRSIGLGIGTSLPEANLEIQSGAPGIFLDDTSEGSTDWYVGNNVNDMEFFITSNGTGGPTGPIMTLDAETGFVGLNSSSPLAPLDIFRNDATQEFLLLESNQAGIVQDRAMMYLVNNGGIRFEFNNPSLGTAWRFQAATGNQDNFEVTKVGSGQVEMRLDSVGNLTITGNYLQNSDRNVKRDIETIDGTDVLTRLDQLPLSEWSYIADQEGVRHVGPMAQDFYAAFGLGSDETKIAPGDMAGVSLAAIKTLSERNANLEERVAQLEALVTQLLPKVAKN